MFFRIVALAMMAPAALAQSPETVSGIELDPNAGDARGPVFQSWLSPHQEGGEEEETPRMVPAQFKSSTGPSVAREDRPSRGHGTLTFNRDLSKAYAHVKIVGVKTSEINMFHIHCGRPGQLGPIIVDFGSARDLVEEFADGEVFFEIDNDDIAETVAHGHGVIGALTAGCPIVQSIPNDKVKTVAGMANIAFERELYFNLHTTSQSYFGDIRGQLYLVE